MRFHVIACDYDGTLAADGRVDAATVDALERVSASGRRLVLVTGRILDDLAEVFPQMEMFDRVVAENGALVHDPATGASRLVCEPAPASLVDALRAKGVTPLSVGQAIVATWEPYETVVVEAIRELGLELHVIFNKGAVMVLPAMVTKATGFAAALDDLLLSPHNAVAIGDAENDHALLSFCECGVAVANALPALKERSDLVVRGDHGAGVRELVEALLRDDLVSTPLARHSLEIGTGERGHAMLLEPYGHSIVLAGPSGSGKSTLVSSLIEVLVASGYQFCLIDPEGDYETVEGALVLGDHDHPVAAAEILDALGDPRGNVVANLLGIALDDRPGFFAELLPHLRALRSGHGRPHWIIVDEAHHLLPTRWEPATEMLSQTDSGFVFVTVHPDRVSETALALVDIAVSVGDAPDETLATFARHVGVAPPQAELGRPLEDGEALAWRVGGGLDRFAIRPPTAERSRHRRKYAFGDLGEDASFTFTGPDGRLSLRAQNLALFVQIGEGVDDETWLYHLRRGDYSCWLRHTIKDEELADGVARIEQGAHLSASASRARIASLMHERYTLPA